MHKNIIVGYDGSSFSRAALTWALDEANRTGCAVGIVYADQWPVLAPAASMVPSPALRPESYVDEVITGMLTRAVAAAHRTHPLVEVTSRTIRAHPATALIDCSRHARLMVLGIRGHSMVTDLFGSVVSAVSAHARCPVVVVRGDPASNAPVVAGVDDSVAAPAVLALAAQQAADRKVPLRIVHAWPPVTGLWQESPMATGTVTGPEREHFDRMVAALRDDFPDLEVEAEAVVDHPAAALIGASETAQLVVVGSRGRGTLRGLMLGSVSRHLLRHSACPIVVVHDGSTR